MRFIYQKRIRKENYPAYLLKLKKEKKNDFNPLAIDGFQVDNVKCAKCDEEMPKNKWQSHNLYEHNNMGWQESDPALVSKLAEFDYKRHNHVPVWLIMFFFFFTFYRTLITIKNCYIESW